MNKHLSLVIGCCFAILPVVVQAQSTTAKPRTIVTTDGEIDDVDSYIRMLLYANEFRIEGLIYSSSQWHYKGDGKGTKFVSEMDMTRTIYGTRTELRWPGTNWMDTLLNAYAQVYPNLRQHAADYPTAEHLRSLVHVGNIDFEGEMDHDTDGSDFIKKKLLDDNNEPLYLQVWGGTNTIARALKSIEDTYKKTDKWPGIYKKVCQKTILYAILDQDATYRTYIKPNWPDIRVLYNSKQFWCLAYFWKTAVPKDLHGVLEGKFMGEKIINNHGPLTRLYYSYGDGQKQAGDPEHIHGNPAKLKNGQWGSFEPYDFISEGDSPSYLHLINVGLDNLEHPEYGGWGGRLVPSQTIPNRWDDEGMVAEYNPYTDTLDNAYAQTRWLDALQRDFAARADWCIKDYAHANHPPAVHLKHGKILTVKAGKKITLSGAVGDPDGQAVTCKWWVYHEAGTYQGTMYLKNADKPTAKLHVPNDLKTGQTIHLILEVTDTGSPQLTRYQRVILVGK